MTKTNLTEKLRSRHLGAYFVVQDLEGVAEKLKLSNFHPALDGTTTCPGGTGALPSCNSCAALRHVEQALSVLREMRDSDGQKVERADDRARKATRGGRP